MKRIIYLFTALLTIALFTGCAVPDKTVPNVQSEVTYSDSDMSKDALAYAETIVKEEGVYTTPATVAAYLHTFNKLPSNFITKQEAQKLGWDSYKGNLDEVVPGKSIGGDRFGNYEKRLPAEDKYRECDVNYSGGRRGAERIVYSDDGDIYYTGDHYESFKQLYGEESK